MIVLPNQTFIRVNSSWKYRNSDDAWSLHATASSDYVALYIDSFPYFYWSHRKGVLAGKVFLQRSNSSDSPSDCRHQTNQTASKLQDLNSPPSPTLNLFDEGNLELKLVSSPSSSSYTVACAL
ncbi:hypothetical protein SADUNF_Sadunf07G0055900 [Salix dunnii]|uniref:Uncharacterized protein n=1 Tax=Salix dunnii TaxID=1413687 RepID=A0A835K078_9ROSI|nr:hypothetical protein SADUNF_Sadunf07G0055900 [Salix dunnii]